MRSGRLDDLALAEASQWLARMQNDARSAEDEGAFKRWLSARPENAAAFDHVTHVWDLAGATSSQRFRPRPTRRALMAALGGVAAVGVGVGIWNTAEARTVRTGVGEQRRLTTPDGARIVLDTNSDLKVPGNSDRPLTLRRGRGGFEVPATGRRPFRIEVGAWTLSCAGGDFDVSTADAGDDLVVHLGVVEAVRHGAPTVHKVASGQRLDLGGGPVRLAAMAIDAETAQAWRKGQLVFVDTPLGEAAAALNRYAQKPIQVSDSLRDVRISGVYRTGAPEAFAQAAAILVGGDVKVFRQRIEVTSSKSTS